MKRATAADAASLLREHRDLLARLPLTFRAFIGVEAEKWPTLFAAEKAYLGALLESLARPPASALVEAFAGVTRLETEAGCRDVRGSDPRQIQDATQGLLRRKGLLPRWRHEVDEVFRRLQPQIDERLYSAAPRRLVVILYGQGITIQRDKLWRRLRGLGTRVPLRIERPPTSEAFLRALFGASAKETIFSALRDSAGHGPHDAWIVEAGESLHSLWGAAAGEGPAYATGLSYARLRAYREMLTRSLYQRVLSGVSGPQELAAYARELDIGPPEGSLLHSDEVVRAFIRDVFLGGNGTLLINNTFVEWACVQALKRAEPRLLVARFGVRDKMKPFSSLLLFSSPRPTDQVPILEDPFGSFVDVEQLSYYLWLNAEKSGAYRKKTLYLLLAEGVDEMLAIRSDDGRARPDLPEASLSDVGVTMAQWLGASLPPSSGQPIMALVAPPAT
ncbi:MAG TPA: hypothetical protein VGV60_12035 [Candidatus Polarisedimenticolia bacterium]|jgi:hypothetical protein|nr:hypothetical protein [Candidatus Polarisedimenticolia bacterium]